jgi:RNA recognition motif-containing protein
MPNPRIHVGGLPYSYDDRQLLDLFTPFGPVRSARIMRDRDTGESRGFAFVEMEDAQHAQTAIAALNGQRFDGVALRVSEARERDAPSNGHPRERQAAPAQRGPATNGQAPAAAGPSRTSHEGDRPRGREAERSSHQAKRPIKGKGSRGRFDDDDPDEY